MSDLFPTAEYVAPDSTYSFHPGDGPHTTDGKTTQISDIVVNAGGEDRDKPTDPKDTKLGHLRARLTTLQDQINVFLTEKMAQEKVVGDDIERKILDEGCEVESDDEVEDPNEGDAKKQRK